MVIDDPSEPDEQPWDKVEDPVAFGLLVGQLICNNIVRVSQITDSMNDATIGTVIWPPIRGPHWNQNFAHWQPELKKIKGNLQIKTGLKARSDCQDWVVNTCCCDGLKICLYFFVMLKSTMFYPYYPILCCKRR